MEDVLRLPLPVASDTTNAEHILCPVCGYDGIHLVRCQVRQGTQHTTVSHDAFVNAESVYVDWNDGATIAITFACDEGHLFELAYRANKGSVHPECQFRANFDSLPNCLRGE